MTGKGDGRRPGKGYADNYDNIFNISDARKKRDNYDATDALDARRDEVINMCVLMGFTEEETDAVLEDMGL